jgi:ribosomal protein L29
METTPAELVQIIGLKEVELFLLRRQLAALQGELELMRKKKVKKAPEAPNG